MSVREDTMFLRVVVFVSFSVTSAVVRAEPVADASYVAAVYEHNVILNPEPRVPLSRPAALTHLQRNLDVYEEQAGRAAQQVCSGQEVVPKFCSAKDTVLMTHLIKHSHVD